MNEIKADPVLVIEELSLQNAQLNQERAVFLTLIRKYKERVKELEDELEGAKVSRVGEKE